MGPEQREKPRASGAEDTGTEALPEETQEDGEEGRGVRSPGKEKQLGITPELYRTGGSGEHENIPMGVGVGVGMAVVYSKNL